MDKRLVLHLSLVYRVNMNNILRLIHTAQKIKFTINDCFSKCDQIRSFLRFPADLVTFTEEILDGKLQFLCSIMWI